MKYRNANTILPEDLISLIQEYVQGEYLYIPVKDKYAIEASTEYKTELRKRDAHIYIRHLEGMSNKRLSEIYNLSESSIRRIIIKQTKGYLAMDRQITQILFHWGLEHSPTKQIYDTAWQIDDRYVLKAYQSLDKLKRNLKILDILDSMHIPVGTIVPTHDKQPYLSYGNTFWFLSKKLPGSNLICIDNVENIALTMGEIIANLHIAFKSCEKNDVFWNNSLLDEMNGWVKKNFENNNWSLVSQEKYKTVVSALADIYEQLPVQLIHRDVHFGNFLFDNGSFSGYIDFDLSQRNIRIFDICYFLLGLLSEKDKFQITEEQWFVFVKHSFIGYSNKLPLSEAEKKAIPYVMECIELLFVSYFESINDNYYVNNTYQIFEFIQKQENRIWKSIR